MVGVKRAVVVALDGVADWASWLPRGYGLSRRLALWSLALDNRWDAGVWRHFPDADAATEWLHSPLNDN